MASSITNPHFPLLYFKVIQFTSQLLLASQLTSVPANRLHPREADVAGKYFGKKKGVNFTVSQEMQFKSPNYISSLKISSSIPAENNSSDTFFDFE